MAHNLKVVGSNPTPATNLARNFKSLWDFDSGDNHAIPLLEALWKQEGKWSSVNLRVRSQWRRH